MTQKANLFKGQQKRKSIPPSRHGKIPVTRKGKRVVKPSKVTKEMDADRGEKDSHLTQQPEMHQERGAGMFGYRRFELGYEEMSKFINYCNEVKAATAANKEGGQLSIVKPQSESTSGAKK